MRVQHTLCLEPQEAAEGGLKTFWLLCLHKKCQLVSNKSCLISRNSSRGADSSAARARAAHAPP